MVKAQDASINDKDVENIDIASNPDKLFNDFMQSQTCHQTFATFLELCQAINLHYPPSPASSCSYASDHITFYPDLKKKLVSWKARSLWSKLDKRFYGKEFFVNPKLHISAGQRIGADTKVVIIGAGPCGLRTAIDMACLGTKVVVLEKRDNFSRNNVLHLWPFIITDLKALGAKKLYGRFCAGAIDHISIRQLQLILLKLALLLGVEIIFNVSFEKLVPPPDINEENDDHVKGWTAAVDPANHPISTFDFDVIVGADGKRNTLQGFKRKEFRGKLAIGLTVNFINRNTTAEAKVEEISGVAYIFNQEFFKGLHKEMGIDLENIVYYKGETHYFVMTAKKHSLISKGVLKQDYDDTSKLLSYENVDREAMLLYAKQAADFSTHHQLPTLDFAINHFGQPDVALFDFTCMYAAENAALFREMNGHKVLSCLVGDSLLEPFWPMGTGCARGFFAAFDTVWATRHWALKRADLQPSDNTVELQVLAERESVYRLLHQTTPQNTVKNLVAYTINPNTRYVNLNSKVVSPHQVMGYYVSDRPFSDPIISPNGKMAIIESAKVKNSKKSFITGSLKRSVSMVRSSKLLSWSRRMTDGYEGVRITDMSSSWKSGLAICALIHRFRPDLIDWEELVESDVEANNQLAFNVAEKQLGISPVMTGTEMAAASKVDKLLMVTYISQFYEIFKLETPTGVPPSVRKEPDAKHENGDAPKSPTGVHHSSPVGLLTRFTQHLKKRSYSIQGKHEEQPKKKKHGSYKKKEEPMLSENSLPVLHEGAEGSKQNDNNTVEVGGTTVKLREKKAQDAAQPNSNNKPKVSDRISALSSQLISQWEQNAPQSSPKPAKRQAEASSELPIPSTSDTCYFCQRRVYIVERLSAEGHFFHRHCFVCFNCGLTLRRGAYEYVNETGKFYCRASCITADQSKSCKYTRKPAEEEHKDGVQNGSTSRYRTPERIELENIRFSMLQQLEELPEEDQTRHNLTGTLPRDREIPVDDDELMSDSSDDDINWEEVLRDNGVANDLSDQSTFGLDSSLEGHPSNLNMTVMSWLSFKSNGHASNHKLSLCNDHDWPMGARPDDEQSDVSVADISSDESSSTNDASSLGSSSSSGISKDQASLPETRRDIESIVASRPEEKSLSNGEITDSTLRSKTPPTSKQQTPTEGLPDAAPTAATHRDSLSSASTSSQVDESDMLAQLTSAPSKSNAGGKRANGKPRTIFSILKKPEANDESADVVTELKQRSKSPRRQEARKTERKYDTLDRVQEYLQKTPIALNRSNQSGDGSRSTSTCSSVSLSSASTDTEDEEDKILQFIDDPSSDLSPSSINPEQALNLTSIDGKMESPPTKGRRIRVVPQQSSLEDPIAASSPPVSDGMRRRANAKIVNDEPTMDEKTTENSVDESFISEYHPPREDAPRKSHSPLAKQLSYGSIERRMKFRLRTRSRWLQQESNSRSLSRSSSLNDSPKSAEQTSPSNMVIIETTPSLDNPLTPTAPPFSRQQSYANDSEFFYTPTADPPKSPPQDRCYDSLRRSLEFDASDYVSAPTTPSVFSPVKNSDSSSKRQLPELPKVPHLEAISPTGSSNNSLDRTRKTARDESRDREDRVRMRIVEKESLLNGDGLDASFSGYSPVPSRKKSSLKKRNRKSSSKDVHDDIGGDQNTRRRIVLSPPEELVKKEKNGKKHRKKEADEKTLTQAKNVVAKDANKEKRSSRLFNFAPRRKNKNKKETKTDDIGTLERKYPNQSDRERAIVRGERFRVPTESFVSPPGTLTGSVKIPSNNDSRDYWAQQRRNSRLSSLTPEQIDAKITRRVQIAARRQAKLEAQKRLRRAQVIQRQLEEVEVRQRDLEERGVQLEKLLRVDKDQKEESNHMQEWCKMIQEKNALLKYENELMIHQRELQLEDVQSRLQQELRERMAMDDKKKTPSELDEEQKILQKMLDVVEQRDSLVALLEEQRLKEKDEYVDSETLLLNKFNDFPSDDTNCLIPSMV